MRPATTGARVNSLDGLRAIAVLLVVAFHVGVPGFAAGFLGVDVFFVLSGFLITTLLLKELTVRGRVDLPRFWARRMLRLLPATLVVVLTVIVWGFLLAPPYRRPGLSTDALWSLLYLGNWRFISSAGYFADDGTDSPLLHLWSLAVEEQFYVLWPLLLAVVGGGAWRGVRHAQVRDSASRLEVARRRSGAIAATAGGLALALTGASALALWWTYDPSAPERAYMGTDTRMFEPLIGAAAAAAMTRRRAQRWVVRHHVALMLAGLAGLVAGVALLGGPSAAYFSGGAVAFSLGCALLVAAATAGGNGHVVARTLGLAPLAYLGRISYGVYLWHWPLAMWLLEGQIHFAPWRALAVTVFAIAFAACSYHLVEVPLRSGALRSWRPARILPLATAALGCTAATAMVLGSTILPAPHTPSAAAAAERSSVVLVGDSVMSRLLPSVAEQGSARGLSVVNAARGGCPALTVPAVDSDGHLLADGACTDRVRTVQDDAVRQADPGVVIWWSRYELADRLGADGRVLHAGTPEFWAAQKASFRADVDRLTSRGATVVVVQTDRPGIGLGTRCSPAKCHPFLQRLWHEDRLRREWNRIVTDVAAHDPRVRTMVIDDVYCRDADVPCDDRLPVSPGATRPAVTDPTPRPTVTTVRGEDLARPDGSHFSADAAPVVAAALLDRATATVP